MRANLRLDVEIRLAYNFGQPKSIFLAFLCKTLFWPREGFFFAETSQSFWQISLFIVWKPFPDANLNPKHFSFYHPPLVLSIFYSAYCLVPWASCVGTKNNKNKQNAAIVL